MSNKQLKAALIHVLGTVKIDYFQTSHCSAGGFYFFPQNFTYRRDVSLGHSGEGWFIYLSHYRCVGLELRTDEGHTELTSYFEDPFHPEDEEVRLFQSLFPLASNSIIKARKELLKIEDKPNE